jgi:bifunctional non-homologous end joining protein LigD
VLLDNLGLLSYPKTSGATGMQIFVPLDRTVDYDNVRGFVGALSDLVHKADPETTTLEWEVKNRTGKVFLDVNMNREGANIAGAYSVRPEWGAPVSTPFTWDELDAIYPELFTMETIFERVAEKGDPFLPVAEGRGQSIHEAIAALDAQPRKARNFKR